MKFVALVSGGKDSIYSILQCQAQGHELVGCVHLAKRQRQQQQQEEEEDEEEEESYMYQSAASEVVQTLVQDCLQVPLICYTRQGSSLQTSLVYHNNNNNNNNQTTPHDEVEDLVQALQQAQHKFPTFTAVSSGAILSTYQRVRVEHVCQRLGLVSLSPLWRYASQQHLLDQMVDEARIEAILVRTAAPPGLHATRHLGQTLGQLRTHFSNLYQKYQFHVCGEGGEYETLVIDCPLYKQRLVMDATEIVETEDGVGDLKILSWHVEPKDANKITLQINNNDNDTNTTKDTTTFNATKQTNNDSKDSITTTDNRSSLTPTMTVSPHVRRVAGGLWHVSEIVSPFVVHNNNNNKDGEQGHSEAEWAVAEANAIFEILSRLLDTHQSKSTDILMVHLYLSEMSHFASINTHYRNFFGTLLPPSRSCVAVGPQTLVGGRRVALDCLVQCGSGEYLRTLDLSPETPRSSPYVMAAQATSNISLRKVLHVQSISHWAPVCVGPYSQCNTYQSCLHFLAGQIGLVPITMTLRDTWEEQLEQAWTNVANVVDALNGTSLDQLLSGLVYVASPIFHKYDTMNKIETICSQARSNNAGVKVGLIDQLPGLTNDDLRGYEDEETMRELTLENIVQGVAQCPLLVVAIPEMPVGALVEIEPIVLSREAWSCLPVTHSNTMRTCDSIKGWTEDERRGWQSGHDPYRPPSDNATKFVIEEHSVTVGKSSMIQFCTAVARVAMNRESFEDDPQQILQSLLREVAKVSGFKRPSCLHLRLYYVCHGDSEARDDGSGLRNLVFMLMGSIFNPVPAVSFVPVDGIDLMSGENATPEERIVYAVQAIMIDPTTVETELWIHQGRQDE